MRGTLVLSLAFLLSCGEKHIGKEGQSRAQSVCVEMGGHNTYVVDKNSVYSKGEISALEGPDYKDLSLKPAHLLFLDTSGRLQNDTFLVLSYTGQQVQTTRCPLRFNYESDQGSSLSQVTSYYYSSLARQFSEERGLSLLGGGTYIINQAPITGWSSRDNTIYLGLDSKTGHDSGLDGSLLLNLIGEANIYYASRGAIYRGTREHHRDCRGKREMCCVSDRGCSKALSIGLSQYFSSQFFREAPSLGETYSNDLGGLEDCGISRDLNRSQRVSMAEAFSACGGASGAAGYVYPMATVYASVWWSVRRRVVESKPQELESFQVFYLEHLESLTGEFRFEEALEAILELDSRKFNSQFSSYFRDEFVRRGIQ